VVVDQVEQDADAAAMRLGDQPVEVRQPAVARVNGRVVGDIVSKVLVRGGETRREPDGVDAQAVGRAVQVVQPVDQPGEVAQSVAVRISERAQVDVVDGSVAPPEPII
jgi:hypothetical protein